MESSDDDYHPSAVSTEANDAEDQRKDPESVGSKSHSASAVPHEICVVGFRKRKRSRSPTKSLFSYKNGNKKARVSAYSNEYRELFNKTIEDCVDPLSRNRDFDFRASQIGSVRWSAAEKDLFFANLDAHGRDGVHAIAEAVKTKSEAEIEAYIQLLERGVHELNLYSDHDRLYGFLDMPAAHEISATCDDMLENAADGLAVRQLCFEEKIQQRKYGSLWNLDSETSKWLKEQSNDVKDHLPPSSNANEVCQSLEMLNLDMFLETSADIFMNSRTSSKNYRTFAASDQTPSIQLTAFLDFYNLLCLITKRIVAASHFYALGRLKALSESQERHRNWRPGTIRVRDVHSAVMSLGMVQSSHEFWVDAARRCRLNVYEDCEQKVKFRRWLAYDEIENLLQDRRRPSASRSLPPNLREEQIRTGSTISEQETIPDLLSESSVDKSPGSSSDSDEITSEIDKTSVTRGATTSPIVKERLQDSYVKALDQRASRKEELSLWELMRKEAPKEIQVKLEEELPRRPPNSRRSKEDLMNWRSWLLYETEWERDRDPVLEESFEENRNLMRASRRSHRDSRQRLLVSESEEPALLDQDRDKSIIDLDMNSGHSGDELHLESELGSDIDAMQLSMSPGAGPCSPRSEDESLELPTSGSVSEHRIDFGPPKPLLASQVRKDLQIFKHGSDGE